MTSAERRVGMSSIAFLDPLLHLPWERIPALYIGEKIALGSLLAVTLIECVAAANRFFAGEFHWPKPRKQIRTPKRKKGFGVKWLMVAALALLPGGLAGTAAVYVIMGKEGSRRDALRIVGLALIPALLLALLRVSPWHELHDAVYVSGLLGLVFGLLHVWALVKLLRQWWGEPEECVPWWPPAALCLQCVVLAGVAVRLMEP